MEKIGVLITVLILFLAIALAIKWEIYKYNDCKKVGHSTVYCVFTKR